MSDGSLEAQAELQRERDAWSSPWYPALFFLVAMPIELWCWWEAPYMQFGWQVVLGLTIVVAVVPWIGSRQHRGDSEALRRHPARFGFLLPALLLHAGMFALYGPYWRSGAADGSINVNRLLVGLVDAAAMSELLGPAAEREPREVAFLLRLGADPNGRDASGRHPLDRAMTAQTVDLLLAHGARAHSAAIHRTLNLMAHDASAETLSRLLAAGVDADATDPASDDGYTAAHEAAYGDHAAALRVLLSVGADVQRRDRWGRNVLDHARRGESAAALAVLAEFDHRVPAPALGSQAVE